MFVRLVQLPECITADSCQFMNGPLGKTGLCQSQGNVFPGGFGLTIDVLAYQTGKEISEGAFAEDRLPPQALKFAFDVTERLAAEHLCQSG